MLTFTSLALLTTLANPNIQATPKLTFLSAKNKYKDQYSAKIVYPYFKSTSSFYKLVNAENKKLVVSDRDEFINHAKEYFAEFNDFPTHWEYEMTPTVSLIHQKVNSVLYYTYDYSGGAHPNHFFDTVNIGYVNGKPKRLTLTDVVHQGMIDELTEKLIIPAVNVKKKEIGTELITEIPAEDLNDFFISKNGITWMFEPYTLGAYVEGDYMAKLKWSELKPYINQKVIPFPFQ